MKYKIISMTNKDRDIDYVNIVYDELVCELDKPLKVYHKDFGWSTFEGKVLNILEDEYGVLIQITNCDIRVDYVSDFSEELISLGLRNQNFIKYISEDLVDIYRYIGCNSVYIKRNCTDKHCKQNREAIDEQIEILKKCKHDLISKVNAISEYIDYVYSELDEEELL